MIRIYIGSAGYFREHDARQGGESSEVRARVEAILERVRREGDAALVELTAELDGVTITRGELRVSENEVTASASRVSAELRSVLRNAAANIRRYHERQVERGFELELDDGSMLGQKRTPLASVGVYVPGGAASYPSSVLMNVIPARIAGVERIAVCTPPGSFERSAELACAFEELELDEIYRVGGAQAVGALAYGTETIARVDKIVGPGNAYVAEAKRLVFGRVGIDAIAGPSEIVVLADGEASPAYVAADLLSQAEHGSGDESAILVTTSRQLAERTRDALDRQLASLDRRDAIRQVLERHGAAIVVDSLDEAVAVVDRVAPEHLEILVRSPEDVARRVRNAGAIFLGEFSPVPVGDFYAGPNHVLPTGTTARYASPLGVYDFVKRTSLIRYSRERLRRHRADIEAFARAEGFEAHARAIAIRFERETR